MENFTSDLLFIIIVLVGAALLGYLIGHFVNARYKKVLAALNDLASYKKKHMSEYESMKSDLARDEENIKELQKLTSEIDDLKKKIAEHSH